jgi:hypothetical protein
MKIRSFQTLEGSSQRIGTKRIEYLLKRGKKWMLHNFERLVSFSEGKEQIIVFFTYRNGADAEGRRLIILVMSNQSTTSLSDPTVTLQCSYTALHRTCRIRNM